MSKIPPHIIDEIMQTARIEEVIGDFVNLKKKGANYMGLSPFTNEKTPSFSVSPAKQIFKCFSTGKGGTVVTFLMEKEHFSYPEALRWLANRYNIAVPEEREPTAEELAQQTEKESLFIINEFAKNHFVQNLWQSDEGKAVGLTYFEERGFRPDIIQKFQLGFSVNISDDFTKASLTKGYKLEYLERVGLVKSKDDRHFDFFRGRVMFPIHSISGRVLGFGGRTLFTDKKVAKYFNSPESPVYNKSEILYGLYFAKNQIIKEDECLLCEGYTDVISMHQSGIENVVSSSGTSLTKEQVRLVKRYTQNLTILYDGDAAGIKASFRGIDLILEEGMNVKVVLFPDGEDPDSFSKKNSSTELAEYIRSHRQDFITFKSDILLSDGQNDPLKRSELVKEIVHSVALIPDNITRDIYASEIARLFDLSEQLIQTELAKVRKGIIAKELQEPEIRNIPSNGTASFIPSPAPVKYDNTSDEEILFHREKDLIRILLKYGAKELNIPNGTEEPIKTSTLEFVHQELNCDELNFEHPLMNQIYTLMVEGLAEETFYKLSYFIRLENQNIVQFVSDIESENFQISHNWFAKHNIYTKTESDNLYETVVQAIYQFKYFHTDRKLEKLRKKVDNEMPIEDLLLLLEEISIQERVKKALSEKIGRVILR
jgi:DNA primase